MKVKIIAPEGYSGRLGTFKRGEETNLPDDAAKKLIAHRLAVPVGKAQEPKGSVTTAAFDPTENAAARTSKPKGRRRKTQAPQDGD